MLALQRLAGNRAVSELIIQRMPTPTEFLTEVGQPPKGNRVFKRTQKARSASFDVLLGTLDNYRSGLTNAVSRARNPRRVQATTLEGCLRSIAGAAESYTRIGKGPTDTRGARIEGLVDEARSETAQVGAMARDPSYDAGVNPPWGAEIKRRQFELNLTRGRNAVPRMEALERDLSNVGDDPVEERRLRSSIDSAESQLQAGYLGALGLLASDPNLIRQLPLRDVAEVLLEANRRAGDRARQALRGVGKVVGMKELQERIEAVAGHHDGEVAAKTGDVAKGLQQGNAAFSNNELVALTRVDEDITLVCGVVRTTMQTAGLAAPSWLNWMAYRCGARVQELVRAYRRVNTNVVLAQLPRALTAPYTLLGPTNALVEWVKPVFREDSRATGEAAAALDTAREGAASRADDDYAQSLARLENELGVDRSQVEEILKNSLLALAQAPLTVNFSHQKLQLILASGGFKNYWQVNQALNQPGAAATAEEKAKYDYQQTRLEAEHRLFGGTGDLATKKQKASEQAISTGANVANFQLGAAPSITYGRSVALLRNSVKQRATYTPYDALDLMKKINTGEAFVGPEVVGTHDNLAAIIRYAPTAAVKDIVAKAKNPSLVFDLPMANYIEAQIHGPLELRDIEKITIALDDLEDEAASALFDQLQRPPDDDQVKAAADQIKLTIEQTLRAANIDVDFRSML